MLKIALPPEIRQPDHWLPDERTIRFLMQRSNRQLPKSIIRLDLRKRTRPELVPSIYVRRLLIRFCAPNISWQAITYPRGGFSMKPSPSIAERCFGRVDAIQREHRLGYIDPKCCYADVGGFFLHLVHDSTWHIAMPWAGLAKPSTCLKVVGGVLDVSLDCAWHRSGHESASVSGCNT